MVVGSNPINGITFLKKFSPVFPSALDTGQYVDIFGHMDTQKALIAFDALSQETRLRVFRLLVEHGTQGLAAGEIGEKMGIPHNTLSFHLSHMSHAGLVESRRRRVRGHAPFAKSQLCRLGRVAGAH